MILVTGGTGLVGSHLLYQLLQKEKKVRAIYRNKSSIKKVLKVFSYYTITPKIYFDKIEWVWADITDLPSMIPVFKEVTEVYHAAALISFSSKDYIEMRKVNIHGTAIVANLCIDARVKKLCYVSSIAAIGDDIKKEFIDEENEWNDNDKNHGYAITKYGGEMEVWRASQEGVDVVIVNPGVILGSGFWASGSGKLFSQISKGFSFYTEGITGFVGVQDVVNCMIALMEKKLKNERYILVSENKSYKDVLNKIADTLDAKKPSKKVTPWMSELFWRWEFIISFFTRKSPRISKHSARSIHSKSHYSNKKISKELNFSFEQIDTVIEQVGSLYKKRFSINLIPNTLKKLY